MARNYSIAEATRIICEGTDKEAMLDLGRRYPLLAIKLAVITAKAPEIVELMACAPDYLSANKMNKGLKDGVTESDDAEDQDDEQDAEVEEEKPAKRAGKRGAAKKPAKKVEPEDDDDEEEEAETESGDDANPYAGKSAVELYKECKKRGLKIKSKMKASEYAAALVEDDNKGSGSDDAEDGDDWDEDEPEEKPAKKAPKGKKAPAKKAKEEDEDDDDDWDI